MRIGGTDPFTRQSTRWSSNPLSTVLLFVLLSAGGCQKADLELDTASIKSNYANFRNAIIVRDLGKANEFLVPTYPRSNPSEKLFVTFEQITQPQAALASNARVDFKSRDRALLYPQPKPAIGAIAYEFTRATNGWLLTGNWMNVVH